jgi:DNA polymerase V
MLTASHSGDGHSGTPLPPGQLVVTFVVDAADIPAGPQIPLVLNRVSAGFPSPADDYVEGTLNLHELVGAGIYPGDILVVDRAVTPVTGAVVVASIDGALTVKRFVQRGRRVALLAANVDYPPIVLQEGQDLVIFGVVTHSLHDHRVHRTPVPIANDNWAEWDGWPEDGFSDDGFSGDGADGNPDAWVL